MDALNKWQLHFLSQSLSRAKQLEKQREDYYEETYSTITYSAMRMDDTLEGTQSHATDAQAFRIMKLKERYDRRIQREYRRHMRWESILEWVDDHDRIILIRYFQKKKPIQPKIISRILNRIDKRLQTQERQIEKELDAVAAERYKELSKHNQAATTQREEDKDKRNYLINGEFILLTVEEYAARTQEV